MIHSILYRAPFSSLFKNTLALLNHAAPDRPAQTVYLTRRRRESAATRVCVCVFMVALGLASFLPAGEDVALFHPPMPPPQRFSVAVSTSVCALVCLCVQVGAFDTRVNNVVLKDGSDGPLPYSQKHTCTIASAKNIQI